MAVILNERRTDLTTGTRARFEGFILPCGFTWYDVTAHYDREEALYISGPPVQYDGPITKNNYIGIADSFRQPGGPRIISSEPVPELKHVTSERTERSRTPRERWERSKETGEILVAPMLKSTVKVFDKHMVYSNKVLASTLRYTKGVHSEYVGIAASCRNRVYYRYPRIPEVPFATTRGNADGSGILPMPVNVTAFSEAYVSTLSTDYDLRGLAAYIEDVLDKTPAEDGLVTRTAGELSEATWDLMTELAEMPETVKMIYSGLKTCITKYREVRGKVKTLERNRINSGGKLSDPAHLDDVASLWMNYRYGIGPIAYSIQDALEYLAKRSNAYATVRNGANVNVDLAYQGLVGSIDWRDRAWAKAQLDLSSPTKHLSANLFKTWFEVTPLAFVIGWFYNVGDMLASLQPPAGAKQAAYTLSRRCTSTVTMRNPHDSSVDIRIDINYYNTNPIKPSDHIGLPLDVNITWKRILDALSLSWFEFRRR